MKLRITNPWLWLPVEKEKPEVKLHFYVQGEKIQEIDLHLGGTDGDFYTSMDVGRYLGQEMEIRGEIAEDTLYAIFCYRDPVQNVYPFRPQLHFSPSIGWNNDPNGLVYADGLYHLYYQWNPYGVVWGNMHWGHAVSRDLLHWEHRPPAILPDEYGTAYSGCGWADRENITGYGKDALLFYYTAAGGRNQWSADKENLFTQRLKISTDGGDTLQLSDKFCIGHIAGENRDPKVFYHQKSKAYIMLLYLDGYEFAVYRSTDLLCWEETCRFSIKGMWECPDLFELNVENSDGETQWVFWSADGYYVTGDFDGFCFTPTSPVQTAYSTKLPYAAQSYAGLDDGRVISVAWLRMENSRGNYCGLMSLPTELSLVRQEEQYRIKFTPVRELNALKQPVHTLEKGKRRAKISLNGSPTEVVLSWEAQKKGRTSMSLGNYRITADFVRETISFYDLEKHADTAVIPFSRHSPLTLTLIIDQEVIEFFGNHGIIYGAVEMEENILRKTITVDSSVDLHAMTWCELR